MSANNKVNKSREEECTHGHLANTHTIQDSTPVS